MIFVGEYEGTVCEFDPEAEAAEYVKEKLGLTELTDEYREALERETVTYRNLGDWMAKLRAVGLHFAEKIMEGEDVCPAMVYFAMNTFVF
jgi:hypothetical protein